MAQQHSAATRIRRAAHDIFGHATLAVMPTGHGKSAIYQVAAQIIDGLTVIVSPLISLQRDQRQTLAELEAGGHTTRR